MLSQFASLRPTQVLKLGAPVTSLSLSPALDLLATTHVNRRGIYMWSNQVGRTSQVRGSGQQ